MLTQIRAGFTQPSKVDNALHTSLASGSSEYASEVAVLFRVLRSGGCHRMHQVECPLTSLKMACNGRSIRQIRLPDLHPGIFHPVSALELPWYAYETTNRVAGIEQPRSQTSANVTGGSGYRDTLRLGGFRQWVSLTMFSGCELCKCHTFPTPAPCLAGQSLTGVSHRAGWRASLPRPAGG